MGYAAQRRAAVELDCCVTSDKMGDKFTKSNFLKISQEVLEFQLKSLYPLHVQGDPARINLLFLNHDRNFSTFLTVRYLVEHERVTDIYTLSRSLFESIVSMGLLTKSLVSNDLYRYQNYQFIEIYKTYSHLEKLGLAHLSGIASSEIALVKAKRDEYVMRYGNNLSTWTGKSLEQNVKLLDENFPPTCNEEHLHEYLYCQVYRKGSSSTHSSFLGLKKGVKIEQVTIPGSFVAHGFKSDEAHLVFSCFHSLLVFLSSVRFMGHALQKAETEDYFHKIARYIISE
jgi:hypothetical protein